MNKLLSIFLSLAPMVLGGVTVSSEFDPLILPAGSEGTYNIIIDGSRIPPEVVIKSPHGLKLIENGGSQVFADVENKTSTRMFYHFSATAKKPGVYTVNSFKITIGAQEYDVPTAKVQVMHADKFKIFIKARNRAINGDAHAQYKTGLMFYYGNGVIKDYVEAYAWFDLSAEQGHKDAGNILFAMRREMPGSDIADARRLAGELLLEINYNKSGRR